MQSTSSLLHGISHPVDRVDRVSRATLRPTVPHRPSGRRRTWTVGVTVVAAGLLAAACSSTSATSSTSSTSSTGGATAASTGTGTVVVASAPRSGLGTVLVNADGHTLYRLTTDSSSASTCSGACAQLWPPLTVAAGTTPRATSGLSGPVGTITRDDGTMQVTYQGHPLYTYTPDTSATDARGQGVGGVWFVVNAGPARTASTTTTTAASGRSGY
jgi:predicted lipoprotein with Yx(FWY)xxD motif